MMVCWISLDSFQEFLYGRKRSGKAYTRRTGDRLGKVIFLKKRKGGVLSNSWRINSKRRPINPNFLLKTKPGPICRLVIYFCWEHSPPLFLSNHLLSLTYSPFQRNYTLLLLYQQHILLFLYHIPSPTSLLIIYLLKLPLLIDII